MSARAARLAVVALLAVTGCVSLARQYEGAQLPTAKLADIHPGITTKSEVLARFGAPTVVQRRDLEGAFASMAAHFQGQDLMVKLDPALFDDLYIYEYRRVNRTLVFGLFFNYAGSVDKSDRLVFFFDRTGKVAGYGLTEGTKEL